MVYKVYTVPDLSPFAHDWSIQWVQTEQSADNLQRKYTALRVQGGRKPFPTVPGGLSKHEAGWGWGGFGDLSPSSFSTSQWLPEERKSYFQALSQCGTGQPHNLQLTTPTPPTCCLVCLISKSRRSFVSNLMAKESYLLPLRSQEDADGPHNREKQEEPWHSPRVSFSVLGRQLAVSTHRENVN